MVNNPIDCRLRAVVLTGIKKLLILNTYTYIFINLFVHEHDNDLQDVDNDAHSQIITLYATVFIQYTVKR